MNELVVMYFELLRWIIINPALALIFLLAEFCLMYWLYYKFNQNVILKVVFGALFTPQNFIFNMTGMTLIGLGDFPEEGASTLRAKRWKREYIEGSGKWLFWPAPEWVMQWRYDFATFVCKIMNKFDEGHC